MRFRYLALLPVAGCLLAVVQAVAVAAEPDPGQSDEQLLRAAGLTTDAPGLLEFLHRRTAAGVDRERVATLVRQLGDKSPEVRDKATAELVALGPVAVPLLRQAAKDSDEADTADRARRCLHFIEGDRGADVPIAAIRLLSLRRPEGACEALLAYLPFADNDTVLDEVRSALAALAAPGGKPDAALVKALDDPVSLRRATAAEALSRVPDPQVRVSLRKLILENKNSPVVRMRVALALAQTGKDPKAVSTVISLMADVPLPEARLAEDYLLALAADQSPRVPLGSDDASRQRCRDEWAKWWLGTEGPMLVNEFTSRTLTDEVRDKATGFIKQLGDDSFDVREKAMTDLQAMGAAIGSILRQHQNDPDLEVSARVRKVLAAVEAKSTPLSPVVPRLVALRKPPGAAEAMLGFLPFAEDENTLAEVQTALAAVAVRDGKVEPALLKALDDRLPLRRAVAGVALWQAGVAEERPAVRKLLEDADPEARMRVALALAEDREKDAVPVLIASLGDLPPEQALRAEEFLRRVAGEHSPSVALGTDAAARQKCRDAWAAWWRDNAATVDLGVAGAQPRFLGYTTVIYVNPSKIVELGPDNKVRWEINGLNYAYDAQVLPGDRVLIAEYSAAQVTERTTKNEILWRKQIGGPISCQRLPNGNTFIASRNQFVELDKTGKDVSTINRPQGDVNAAMKLRDGTIICVTQIGTCMRLDSNGKELKSFPVGQVILGGIDVTPTGHVLVAQYNNQKVVEFDLEGKSVWEAQVTLPTSVFRLPNGNTLVASQNTAQVVELDRAGKQVWEYKNSQFPGQQPWKARRH
jgi:HEAT repeat protein